MHYHNVTKEHFFILIFTSAATKLKVLSFRSIALLLLKSAYNSVTTPRHKLLKRWLRFLRIIHSTYDRFHRDPTNFVTNFRGLTTHAQNFVWNVANWVCKYPCPALTHSYWPSVSFNGIRNLKPDSRASSARVSRISRVVSSPSRNYFPIPPAAETYEDFVNSLISYHQIPKKKKLSGLSYVGVHREFLSQ